MDDASFVDLGPVVAGAPYRFRLVLLTLTEEGETAPATSYAGTETLSARVGPGGGLPVAFVPDVDWEDPFLSSAPAVILSGDGTETAGVEPGRHDVWLSVDGVERRVARFLMESAPLDPADWGNLVSPSELRDLTAGAFEGLERSGADVLRSLRAASDELRHAVADRYAAAWVGTPRAVDEFTKAYDLLGEPEAVAVLQSSLAARKYVAWRALWHLSFVIGTSESEPQYRRFREDAAAEAARWLGRLLLSIPGLGVISVGGGLRFPRAVR